MGPVDDLLDELTDESLRTATLLGVASIPFTVALSWETFVRSWGGTPGDTVYLGGEIAGWPVIFAALVAGYLYSDRPTESRSAGVRVGIVGASPLLLSHISNSSAVVLAGSLEMAVLATLATPVVVIVGAALGGLVGYVAAILGEKLAERMAGGRPDGAGE